jgi:hypothetical protein
VKAVSDTAILGVTCPAVGARFGVKGADAAALLQQRGLRIPPLPNRAVHWQTGDALGAGCCLRQGNSEFLIELDAKPPAAFATHADLPRAWTLIRTDHSLLLDGAHWPRELAQVCSFDFARLRVEPDLVVMTVMAGISVTVILEPHTGGMPPSRMALRLWCDSGFATYLQDCLRSLVNGGQQ